MVILNSAQKAWNLLNGAICVYKNPEVSVKHLRNSLMAKLTSDLNNLECRETSSCVSIEDGPLQNFTVLVKPNYSDHTLVVGERYQIKDLKCYCPLFLGRRSSGVLVMGINDGSKIVDKLHKSQPIRTYRIKGVLGIATDNFFDDGKIVEKSTFKHVTHSKLDRVLASIQAAHQKKMFELSGLDIQSQAAYELLAQGPIRPEQTKIPILYGIKCTHFASPSFIIEVHCINEYEKYLQTLIHEIGIQVHSTAHCTGIQCIRHSFFSLEHALLQKHWSLQYVLTNLSLCKKIIDDNYKCIQKQSASLRSVKY